MPLGGVFKLRLALHGDFDFAYGHTAFLRAAVRDNSSCPTVKKVQHSVVHLTESYAKLVNAISQIIRFGPTKLVA
jgi:hypothetical protein